MATASTKNHRGATVPQVYEKLRELIIDGHYGPGRRLTQFELSEEHSVGRTPLREALRLLEADGYVTAAANRGVTVTPIDVSHAEELYAIRLLIEPPLLSALTPSFTARDLASMSRHVDRMGVDGVGVKGFQEAHLDLHLVALQRYGPAMRDTVLNLYRQVQRLQRLYMSRPRVVQQVVDIDRHIVDALTAHDGDRAKRLMQLHLIDWALGLILDVDPDHQFGLLITAAAGVGITIHADKKGHLRAPARVEWQVHAGYELPATSNVEPN